MSWEQAKGDLELLKSLPGPWHDATSREDQRGLQRGGCRDFTQGGIKALFRVFVSPRFFGLGNWKLFRKEKLRLLKLDQVAQEEGMHTQCLALGAILFDRSSVRVGKSCIP